MCNIRKLAKADHSLLPLAMALLLAIVGCRSMAPGQWSTDAIINSIGQPDLADRKRLAVIDELTRRKLDHNQHKELGRVFAGVAASPLHSPTIRRRVLELIVADYRGDAPKWLGTALTNSKEPCLRRQIIDHIIDLNDKETLPCLLMALAEDEPSTRPIDSELARAIEHIADQNKTLEEILTGQLKHAQSPRLKIAALTGLCKLTDRDRIVETIMALPPDDDTTGQLQFWAGSFGYVPANFIRFLACQIQQTRLTPAQLETLRHCAASLKKREDYTFDIHDSYLLLSIIDDPHLQLSRSQLVSDIIPRLTKLDHTKRPRSYPNAPDDYAEGFIDQCNHLSYTDLLRIKLLLETLAQAQTTRQLRSFLEQDITDNTSEMGGLSMLDDDTAVFKTYQPGEHSGDNQYIESPRMIYDAALSLTRWHCHVDKWRGPELAGPGIDDLRYGRLHGCPVVVVTLVTDKIFNVDYFTPEGIVIDLGNY